MDIIDKGYEIFREDHINFYVRSSVHREALYKIFDEYWRRLANMAASKTGRYHHEIENIIPFGMINHKIRGAYFVRELAKEEGIQHLTDDLLIGIYCHDIGNIRVRSSRALHYNDHGKIGVDMIREHVVELQNSQLIFDAVHNHMHHWCGLKMEGVHDRIVAYADYLASRPEIDVKGIKYLTKEMFEDKSEIEEIEEDEVFNTWK